MIVLCNGNATPCCQAVSLTVIVSQCLREFLRLCGPRYVFRTRQCTSPLFRLSLGRWNARLGFSQLASRWASGAAVLGTGGCWAPGLFADIAAHRMRGQAAFYEHAAYYVASLGLGYDVKLLTPSL